MILTHNTAQNSKRIFKISSVEIEKLYTFIILTFYVYAHILKQEKVNVIFKMNSLQEQNKYQFLKVNVCLKNEF